MQLHELSPAPGAHRRRRRVARGIAGKGGKTAGRGTKGQKARNQVKPGFEGGQLQLAQRIPKLRGFANPFRVEYNVVNLDVLQRLEGVSEVSPETLRQAGVVHHKGLVKVLGRGELTRRLEVRAHAFSRSAVEAIERAGGTARVVPPPSGDRRPPARGNALANR
jgi:large subunit ribosomal protein L15